MKIAITSDVHLEFGDLDIQNDQDADVLILSGDICVASDLDMWDRRQSEMGFARRRSEMFHEFFRRCAERFPHVIYVAGNHEHYHGDFATTVPDIKVKLAYIKNLHVLEREIKIIDDVTFIGGTLWTDMNNGDALTLFHMRKMMNDFVCVKNSQRPVYRTVPLYQKDEHGQYVEDEQGNKTQISVKKKQEASRFSPEDAVDEHTKTKGYIQHIVEGRFDDKFVVVGHHSPSRMSTHPRYAHDTIMNGGYSSNMEEFIMDHPQIRLWTHGHTHDDFDYMIGTTRVVCNPRGYINYEPKASEWKLKTVEI
jgi:Icc-related predicted phosphoesterase